MRITIGFYIALTFLNKLFAADIKTSSKQEIINILKVYDAGICGSLVGCGPCWIIKRPMFSSNRRYCDEQILNTAQIKTILSKKNMQTEEEKIANIRTILNNMNTVKNYKYMQKDIFFQHFNDIVKVVLNRWERSLVPFDAQKYKEEEIRRNQAAKEEIEAHLFDGEECIVCLAKSPNVVFLPCGHMSVCKDCQPKPSNLPCMNCRSTIKAIIELTGDLNTCKTIGCKNIPIYYCALCKEINFCKSCKQKNCSKCNTELQKLFRPNFND